jgi:uncharacterized protein YggU (UPF0235/DUF167 family)
MAFFEAYKSGFIVRIKLTPNAAADDFKDVLVAPGGLEYLRASVTAVPEKGKANQELIKMLSKKLKLPKNIFSIVSGETDHWKKILVDTPLTEDISRNILTLPKEK